MGGEEEEEWLTVEGFDRYEISNRCRVRVKETGLILEQIKVGHFKKVKVDYLYKWVPDLMCKTWGWTEWKPWYVP